MTLGQAILNYRTEHDMSMRAFARESGLSATYISSLEKDITPRGSKPVPTIETYKAVAKAMHLTIDELIRMVEDKVSFRSEESDEDAELLEYLDMLRNRPECRILLKTAKGATKAEVERNVAVIETLINHEKTD